MKKKIEEFCYTCRFWNESENASVGDCINQKAVELYSSRSNYDFCCGEWERGSDLYLRKSYSKLNV